MFNLGETWVNDWSENPDLTKDDHWTITKIEDEPTKGRLIGFQALHHGGEYLVPEWWFDKYTLFKVEGVRNGRPGKVPGSTRAERRG